MTEADLPTHYSSSSVMENYTKKDGKEKMEGIHNTLKKID